MGFEPANGSDSERERCGALKILSHVLEGFSAIDQFENKHLKIGTSPFFLATLSSYGSTENTLIGSMRGIICF